MISSGTLDFKALREFHVHRALDFGLGISHNNVDLLGLPIV